MFAINIPFLSLDQMYKTEQSFRWVKLLDDQSKYFIQNGNASVVVFQSKEKFVFSCSENEFFDHWFHYFDLSYDYSDLNFKSKSLSKAMKAIAVRSQGIRILNLDMYETIISLMLGDKLTKRLSSQLGKKRSQNVQGLGSFIWYEIPKPDEIIRWFESIHVDGKESDLYDFASDMVDGWFNLIPNEYDDIKDYLSNFEYLTQGMVDKLCLYCFHMTDIILNDEESLWIMSEIFGSDDLDEIIDWHLSEIEIKSMIQQYIMFDIANPPSNNEKDILNILLLEPKKRRRKKKVDGVN